MSMMSNSTAASEAAVIEAAVLLRNAKHAVVFTGAGISTPSGIPDFRSQNTGLWERFDPMEVASLGSFQSHPEKFFNWLRPLLQTIWSAEPNPAHHALSQLEAKGIVKALITQNIDDLHERAGSRSIYEVHGSLRTMTCPGCKETYPSEQFRSQLEKADHTGDGFPRCPNCNRIMKPDITLFGEMLPPDVWQEAEEHCKRADVMLVVGSSLEVWPAASLPELAVEHGAHLIIANLSPTYLDNEAKVLLQANVAEVLPEVVKRI